MANRFFKSAGFLLSSLMPLIVSAQTPTDFSGFVYAFVALLDALIPVLTGAAFLAFVWGLVKFISSAGDEKKLAEGKSIMVWGTIALFVMISVWGIIKFAYGEFGFSDSFQFPAYLPITSQ